MICSLTGVVASEKVSKARKFFDKKLTHNRVECNGVSLFDCKIDRLSKDRKEIIIFFKSNFFFQVGHNDPAILCGKIRWLTEKITRDNRLIIFER